MPKISLKGREMPESPIRKLVPFAEEAKKKGIHVYHLNIGQPDIETPQAALDAVKNNDIKVLTNGTEIPFNKGEGYIEFETQTGESYLLKY